MKNLNEEIRKAVKEGNVILGFRRSLKYLKNNKPKVVVIANNIPGKMVEELNFVKEKLKIFEGSSKELGTLCGKPYPVSTLVIKK